MLAFSTNRNRCDVRNEHGRVINLLKDRCYNIG